MVGIETGRHRGPNFASLQKQGQAIESLHFNPEENPAATLAALDGFFR